MSIIKTLPKPVEPRLERPYPGQEIVFTTTTGSVYSGAYSASLDVVYSAPSLGGPSLPFYFDSVTSWAGAADLLELAESME